MRNLTRPIARFRRTEEGSATIEAVLWLPVFYFIFCAIVDVSFVFHKQAEAYRVVQDANRALSVGRLTDAAATQAWVKTHTAHISPGAMVSTTVNSGIIQTQVRMPIEDLDATGMFGWLTGYNITVASAFYKEV